MLARTNVRSRRKEAWRGWLERRFGPICDICANTKSIALAHQIKYLTLL
jgi:hypothetical protein